MVTKNWCFKYAYLDETKTEKGEWWWAREAG